MLRLGVKLTHDGAIALVDGAKLVFSHEAEKSNNNPRYSDLSLVDVVATLADYGYSLSEIDRVIVDGWFDGFATLRQEGRRIQIRVAPYQEHAGREPLESLDFPGTVFVEGPARYKSYSHAAAHVVGAYATSPFARRREGSLVLVWDGGMLPRLYEFAPDEPAVYWRRPLFGFLGNVYAVFAAHTATFAPSRVFEEEVPLDMKTLLGLPGKVMAYAGLGKVDETLFPLFESVYSDNLHLGWDFAYVFGREVTRRVRGGGITDEDLLASFQAFIGELLVTSLGDVLSRGPQLPRNLCLVGGCALNITWNTRVRTSGLFSDIWVPPFPNDTGSALGCAAADFVSSSEGVALDWDVYAGPPLKGGTLADGWRCDPCSVRQLAGLLHDTGEPVVFLNGRAELGPRALGNRSIMCAATNPDTTAKLNDIKQRDWYRPIAPICLEAHAPRIFEPGTPDPYMLFTHFVRGSWQSKVPAIVHVDGTARLQTISAQQNPVVAGLLHEYYLLSDIPLLCNTSANRKGCGFFPDLSSAFAWRKVRFVWSEGVLYERTSAT